MRLACTLRTANHSLQKALLHVMQEPRPLRQIAGYSEKDASHGIMTKDTTSWIYHLWWRCEQTPVRHGDSSRASEPSRLAPRLSGTLQERRLTHVRPLSSISTVARVWRHEACTFHRLPHLASRPCIFRLCLQAAESLDLVHAHRPIGSCLYQAWSLDFAPAETVIAHQCQRFTKTILL